MIDGEYIKSIVETNDENKTIFQKMIDYVSSLSKEKREILKNIIIDDQYNEFISKINDMSKDELKTLRDIIAFNHGFASEVDSLSTEQVDKLSSTISKK